MSDDLIQTVRNGVVDQQLKASAKGTRGNNELGKDAFLQLLVTQMRYQDPLNPSSNTEYIAQLATFSQLEQMQNLGDLTSNSQAFSIVGKDVIVKTQNESGKLYYTSGRVDFVNMSGGKTQISVNGNLYPIDQLDSVIDSMYIFERGIPGVKEKLELDYDADEPKDVTFDVFMGEGETIADDVRIIIGNVLLDTATVDLSGNKITIDKSVFEDVANGKYNINVLFNDVLQTISAGMVSVDVINSEGEGNFTEEPDETGGDDETGDDETGGTDETGGSDETDDTDGY